MTTGTTTSIHADDSAHGTSYNYTDAKGYANLGWVGIKTVKEALDEISYAALRGTDFATTINAGINRLATNTEMGTITMTGSSTLEASVTVRALQHWVKTVAPAGVGTLGFTKVATEALMVANNGVDSSVVSPSKLNYWASNSRKASTTLRGLVVLSGVTESNNPAVTDKAVTPQGLNYVISQFAAGVPDKFPATTEIAGVVKLAYNADAAVSAPTDNTKALSPTSGKAGFDKWITDWWENNNDQALLASILKSFVGQEADFPPTVGGPGTNWVPKNGSLISRISYQNLWDWVEEHDLAVSESQWLAYQSESPTGAVAVYSIGNGSTTFRTPTVGTAGGFRKSTLDGNETDVHIGFTSQNLSHGHSTTDHHHPLSINTSVSVGHKHDRGDMNITGTFALGRLPLQVTKATGAYTAIGWAKADGHGTSSRNAWSEVDFDASKTWDGDTSENGSHEHTVSGDTNSASVTIGSQGGAEARPAGHYVKTFIYVGNVIDLGNVLPDPSWLTQQNVNTAAIADLQAKNDMPLGSIIMYDSNEPIPAGWAVCDGTNGTPDLRSKFIVGVDSRSSDFTTKGKTGGALSYKHKHDINVKDHTLLWTEIPPHKHTMPWGEHHSSDAYHPWGKDDRFGRKNIGAKGNDTDNYRYFTNSDITNPTSANGSSYHNKAAGHKHGASSVDATLKSLPPYYTAVYIKRIA